MTWTAPATAVDTEDGGAAGAAATLPHRAGPGQDPADPCGAGDVEVDLGLGGLPGVAGEDAVGTDSRWILLVSPAEVCIAS